MATIVVNSELNAHTFDILSKVSGQRSTVYRWLATGFYPPEELLVQALGDGSMKRELFEATFWLVRINNRFSHPLMPWMITVVQISRL